MQFWSLKAGPEIGPIDYEKARELQLRLVELRAQDRIPDTLLFLEHTPVITRGRGLQFTGEPRPRHMPIPVTLPPGVQFVESERGGDLTYHGPGQLVIYPIFKLDGQGFAPQHDLTAFLRGMEAILIDELRARGLPAEARESATGVWVGDHKIASMGVAVRKWVTYHGLALNVVNDLRPFHLISPCGFSAEVMTRVQDLLPQTPKAAGDGSWRQDWEQAIARRVAAQVALDQAEVRTVFLEEKSLHLPQTL